MRITFVNSAWPQSWGGGEKWTVEAAEWFYDRGDEICVIGRPRSKLIAAAQGRQLAVQEHRFGGDFDPLAILKARQLLKDSLPDLVVVNFNKEAWQFGLAARKFRIPVVARHGFPLLRDTVHHRQLVANVLSRVVVNARSIKERYAALHFDVSGIPVIHNGVKSITQRPGELRKRFGVPDESLLIVAAGRLETQKRFERVIDIAETLYPAHADLKVLIAGEGPLRALLEQEAGRCGLSDVIRLAGFVPDLAEIVDDADLFLLTSDEEGTPNVLLEAMAARVACVAFAVGSVPEIFNRELRANMIPDGNVGAMTVRTEELLSDHSLRMTIANQMYSRVQEAFTFEGSMQQFADLFERTLRERP